MLREPELVPAAVYARCAVSLGWEAALVRAIARQESAEDWTAIRFEALKWKLYRFASRQAKAFDGQKNPKTIAARWDLFKAMDAVCAADADINPAARDAAVLSHSFGFSQIMGFNHKHCGFESAQAFYQAQLTLEGQASSFVAFARASPRLVELGKRLDLRPRNKPGVKVVIERKRQVYELGDLSELSAHWNGPAYWKHGYDFSLNRHLEFARREEGGHAAA